MVVSRVRPAHPAPRFIEVSVFPISIPRIITLVVVASPLLVAMALSGCSFDPCYPPGATKSACRASEDPTSAEQGGGVVALELPIPDGDMLQCVQGAGGSYSHSGDSTLHDIDLDTSNTESEEVYAPTGGTAYVHTESATTNFGYHVNIDMGDGTYAVVAHMSEVFVTDGAEVAAGQLLGFEGCTGACTGDHIHIGRHDGDPALKAEYGDSVEVTYYVEDATQESGFAYLSGDDFVCGLTSMGDEKNGDWYRSGLPVTRWHPNGTLVKAADSVEVYRLDDGQRRWIQDEDVFWSYGYDFDNVVTVASEELDCYEQGSDIAQDGMVDAVYDEDGRLWLIVAPKERSDRYRIEVRDTAWDAVLASWGLSYSQDEPPLMVSDEDEYMADWPEADGYAAFRDGSLVKEESSSDVYVISDGVAVPVKDWDTYLLLGFHDREILTVPDGAVEDVQELVGSCGAGLWCLDATAITTCGGGLELGDGESGGVSDSDDSSESDVSDEDAENSVENENSDTGVDSGNADSNNDSGTGSGDSSDSSSGSSADVSAVEDTGSSGSSSSDASEDSGSASSATRTLTVGWATPFSAAADTITLSGEYVFADGSYGFTWRDLAAESSSASIEYAVFGVGSGDTFRFSVEYEDAMGNVSWSCIAPYPPGTLQGTASADVDGSSVTISAADDPTSDGCGLILTVP